VVNYQGRLTDSNGLPLEGTVAKLTFRLYSTAAPSSGSFLWGEAHTNVTVSRGVFTVELGAGDLTVDSAGNETAGSNPLGSSLFDQPDRYLEIQVDTDPPLTPTSRLGSVPYALNAGGGVPVGTIIEWYRPTPSTAIPDGWAVCDGSTVSDAASPMNGQPTPNLVGRFTSGLDPAQVTPTTYGAGTATPLPEQGGQNSVDLTHGHAIPNHSHATPAHSHGINADGAHSHTAFLGDANGHITTPIQNHGAGSFWAFLGPGANCQHQVPVQVASGGSHSHGGATAAGGAGTTSQVGLSASSALGPVENRPQYVGLLKLIRVR